MSLVVAIAVTAVLFLYSLGLRAAHIVHDREMQRLKRGWWPVFARASMGERGQQTGRRRRRGSASRVRLLREWCRFRAQIRGESTEVLEELAKDLGLLGTARRLLRKRSISNRLLAVQALGYLRDTDSWASIEELLAHPNVPISIMAATALTHIDAERAIPIVIPAICERKRWPRTQIGRILSVAGPDNVTQVLCRSIESANDEDATCLLQFFESAYMNEMDSLAARLLTTRSDPGLLAAALKAVRGHLPDPVIHRLATNRVWYVRMQAANLLGRFGRREDYAVLEPLLSDSEWWVRYRAAQAITKLPFLGPNALRKLCNRQTDRYAHGAMQHALAEAGLA
jgi:HEAT repeats